ncbi:MAG: O-antigen ligase family protein [Chloroflexi bacterium]|nr:O-antigen ligase family protein [Anaerolineaceae bacterium]NMB90025.1 O-antigen ligase family protein [Chloroflexota bacterium]
MISRWIYFLGTFSLVLNLVRPFNLGISIPDFLFLAALCAFVIEGLAKKKPLVEWMPVHALWIPAFLILIGGLVASVGAVSTRASFSVALKEWYVFSIWASMGVIMAMRGESWNVITALILGALFTSAIAVVDFIFGTNLGAMFVQTGTGEPTIFYYRVTGTLGHPNELGMFLAVVAPLVLDRIILLAHKSHPVYGRILFYIFALGCMFVALVFTGSVTGYVGFGFSVVLVLAFHVIIAGRNASWQPWLRLAMLGVLVATFFVVLLLSISDHYQIENRLEARNTMNRIVEITGPSRFVYLKEGIDYIASNPFWGAGMDQGGTSGLDASYFVTSYYIHNTLLESWLAGGLLVFLGTLWLYWITGITALRSVWRQLKNRSATMALGLSCSVFGWMLMDMAQPNIYQRYKWLVIALLIGLAWVRQKGRLKERVPSPRLPENRYHPEGGAPVVERRPSKAWDAGRP